MPSKLDLLHARVRENRWLKIFTIVTRVLLALAFLPSGITKVMGNRFTVLGIDNPVGSFSKRLPNRFLLEVPRHLPTHSGAPPVDSKDLDARSPRLFPAHPEYLRDHSFASLHRHPSGNRADVLANVYLLCWDYAKLKKIF